jgi:iron complex transport system ATP-binding protein
MNVLETQALTTGYWLRRHSQRVISHDLNLSLPQGRLVCLIGPNGAGKSTLLRTLAGMQAPLKGDVRLLGDDLHSLSIEERAKRLSIVLTERLEAEAMRGFDLVALGRTPHTAWTGRLTEHDHARIAWAVAQVGAQDIVGRIVNELSDGQRQKLMIARALAQETPVILLDEPTAYLDLPRRIETLRLLRQLARDAQRAILLSTHDLDLALRAADDLWLMSAEGHLEQGIPEDLVLSGALARIFDSDGVHFDLASGTFRMNRAPRGALRLQGQGVLAYWTRHALERADWRIVEHAPLTVRVASDALTKWQLDTPTGTSYGDSIADLLQALAPYLNQDSTT